LLALSLVVWGLAQAGISRDLSSNARHRLGGTRYDVGKTKTQQKDAIKLKTGDGKHDVDDRIKKLIEMGRIEEASLPKAPGSKGAPPQTYVVIKPWGLNGLEPIEDDDI